MSAMSSARTLRVLSFLVGMASSSAAWAQQAAPPAGAPAPPAAAPAPAAAAPAPQPPPRQPVPLLTVVVVAEPDAVGVDPGTAAAFADLVREAVARQPGWRVIPRAQTPQQPCGEPGCAVPLAQQAGAGGTVILSLSQVGQRIIIRIGLVWVDGRVLFQDRVTAATPEDLDPLAQRTAVAIATGKPVGDTATVSTMTVAETAPPPRKQGMFTNGLRMGTFLPIAGSYGGATSMFDLGWIGLIEIDRIGLAIDLDVLFPTSDSEVTALAFQLNFGGRYFLDPQSPTGIYVGGGFGYRAVAVSDSSLLGDDGSGSGLGGYLGVGVVFLRNADVHIILDARYDANFFTIDDVSGAKEAHGLMLTAGFTFKGFFGRRWFL
jgi:hypothetical protein